MVDPSTITDSAAPNPQAVVVQRLRIRYAKRGRLRFTSHRDFARAFERAIRRSHLPIGFSSGFSPHPKISYANAAPTGSASEAEFLEIGLTQEREPADVQRALDEALPPGLDILDVIVAAPGSLADRLEASEWRIELPEAESAQLAAAVAAFLATDDVSVERMTKRGLRAIDVRGAVVDLTVDDSTTVTAVVRSTIPTVRPEDIITGLRQQGLAPGGTSLAQRLRQGPLRGSDVGDPLHD